MAPIESLSVTHTAGTAGALGTWVAVPATDRVDQRADASAPQPSSAPGPVPVARVMAATVSVEVHHRAIERTPNVADCGGP
jgi:hypothetical protein